MPMVRVSNGGTLQPTFITVADGATSFTSTVGSYYVVSKNVNLSATPSISGCTVLATSTITTTASRVYQWAVVAIATTISISGASTGGITVLQLED